MIAGEPAFQPGDQDGPEPSEDKEKTETVNVNVVQQQPEAPEGGTISRGRRLDETGRKIIPEVQLIRCEYHPNGDQVMVSAHVRNNSDFRVEVDKIDIFGEMRRINRWLDPGQTHEEVVYRGPMLTSTAYHEAEVYYKDCESGDYFCARHMIEYRPEDGGTYRPCEFHLLHPIKDV